MPSATVAESRLSSAPSAATATAGSTRLDTDPQGTCGMLGIGRPRGMSPMTGTSRWAKRAISAATTTAGSDSGHDGLKRTPSSIAAMTPAARSGSAQCGDDSHVRSESNATSATFSP